MNIQSICRFAASMGTALTIVLAVAGCSGSVVTPGTPGTASISPVTQPVDPAVKASGSVRIALLLPLSATGEPAQIARGMKQAAEMALFEANNPAVQLIVKDDAGTSEGAARATEAAISEGAQIVLGPLLSKAVTGAAPVARTASVPVIAFSNDPHVAGNGVYLISFLASLEVDRIVDFAASKGKRRFAALIPSGPYGQTVEPAFRKAVARSGGEIVRLETFSTDASGMLASAKRVVAAITEAAKAGNPIDALFLPAGQETIAELAPLLSYAGVDGSKIKLIGTSTWDMPVISRADQLIGGWYAASEPAAWGQFAGKFRQTYGQEPPRLATLAYDAMGVALTLAREPKGERYQAANLTRANGFAGVDGPVRLEPNGLSARGLAVLEIEKYRSVVIDAARQPAATDKTSVSGGPPRMF